MAPGHRAWFAFGPLGLLTAGFAAWRAPRHRGAFLGVTALWLIELVFFYPWGGGGFGAGSLPPH